MTAEGGEREGWAEAIASYKNPYSHRDVNLDDPHEALEIILLAIHRNAGLLGWPKRTASEDAGTLNGSHAADFATG